jgi:flagellar biosynthesis protein FlhB
MEPRAGEPTVEPTPRRREQARRAGDVPHSPDLTALLGLLGGAAALLATAKAALAAWTGFARGAWGGSPGDPVGVLRAAARLGGRTAAPMLAAALFSALAAGLAQSKGLFSPALLRPKLRWGRRVSTWSAARVGLLGALAAAVVALSARSVVHRAAALAGTTPGRWPESLSALAVTLWGPLLGLVAAVALADALARRAAWRRRLRMTPRELRREQREEEGDPWLAEQRRRSHRELLTGQDGGD